VIGYAAERKGMSQGKKKKKPPKVINASLVRPVKKKKRETNCGKVETG